MRFPSKPKLEEGTRDNFQKLFLKSWFATSRESNRCKMMKIEHSYFAFLILPKAQNAKIHSKVMHATPYACIIIRATHQTETAEIFAIRIYVFVSFLQQGERAIRIFRFLWCGFSQLDKAFRPLGTCVLPDYFSTLCEMPLPNKQQIVFLL